MEGTNFFCVYGRINMAINSLKLLPPGRCSLLLLPLILDLPVTDLILQLSKSDVMSVTDLSFKESHSFCLEELALWSQVSWEEAKLATLRHSRGRERGLTSPQLPMWIRKTFPWLYSQLSDSHHTRGTERNHPNEPIIWGFRTIQDNNKLLFCHWVCSMV